MKVTELLKKDKLITLEELNKHDISRRMLLSQGFTELNQNNLDEALIYFKSYENIIPTNYANLFMILYILVKQEKYESALDYCFKLLPSENYRNDTYLYLILIGDHLNKEIPELDNITYLDIMISPDDERFFNTMKQNEIRAAIYQSDYRKALRLMNKYRKQGKLGYQDIIISKMIFKNNEKIIDNIIDLFIEEDYETLIYYFENIENRSPIETLQLQLVKTFINLRKGNILPDKKVLPASYNIYDAVNANDYEKALQTCNNKFTQILLENIIAINQYNIENKYLNILSDDLYSLIEFLYEAFANQDYTGVEDRINEYLISINREKYKKYIKIIYLKTKKTNDDLEATDNIEYEFSYNLAELTDALVNVSLPIAKIDNNYLEELAKEYLRKKDKNEANRIVPFLEAKEFYKKAISSKKEIHTDYIIDYNEENIDSILDNIESLGDIYKFCVLDTDIVDKIMEKLKERTNIKYLMSFNDSYFDIIVCQKGREKVELEELREEYQKAKILKMNRKYTKSYEIVLRYLLALDYFDQDLLKTLSQLYEKMGLERMSKKYYQIFMQVHTLNKKNIENEEEDLDIMDEEFNYSIDNIDEIIKSYHEYHSLTKVLEEFEINEEDRLYIMVILARESYRDNFFRNGNKILEKVKSEIKENNIDDIELSRFIKVVELNKPYFKYRQPHTFKEKLLELIKGE